MRRQSHTIENTILTCEDMNTRVITTHDVTLYLGESLIECGGIIYYTMYVILKYIYLQINCGIFNENDWSRLVLNYNFAAYLSLLIKDPRPTTLQSTENSESLYLVSKPFDIIYNFIQFYELTMAILPLLLSLTNNQPKWKVNSRASLLTMRNCYTINQIIWNVFVKDIPNDNIVLTADNDKLL